MTMTSKKWLLLIVSLPTNSATTRMRIWRSLKSLGCGLLRDGAYLLPADEALHRQLTTLGDDTMREGGNAWLLDVQSSNAEEETRYRALFDRSQSYTELTGLLAETGKSVGTSTPQEAARLLRKLRREYDALRSIDYFPNEASARAEQAWKEFAALADAVLTADEPCAIAAAIARLDIRDYQGRLWATRRRLWVDRVASAWLIRRHIDHDAHFVWLDSPADCPPDALGFDFDGAAFTHVGDKVTFEVLLASFNLDRDKGLARLGALVHVLDIGNGFVAEAAGFEAMLAGLRQRARDDNELLEQAGSILDALYAHFSSTPASPLSAGEKAA
ncbi:chromate resistance protein ChrB domain-containing protein [Massilia sp. LXY-6]|uniref:chromate resistance protein ChrB domain-containing protein n=1 Tax=Massilia sp. LXY-6 TaxID=3379823 RepID=UPI003EE033C8